MLIFLIVLLVLAALLEYLSIRSGTSRIGADFTLSRTRTEIRESVELVIDLRNSGRLPISYGLVRIDCPLTAVWPEGTSLRRDLTRCTIEHMFRLWGRRGTERSLPFQMERRGVFTFEGRELVRGDFLGLRLEKSRFDTRRTILVYPPRLNDSRLAEALGSTFGELSARRWLLRDPVLVMGVREYTSQDPMHTISWNQTARRGALTVREFDFTRSLNCCVILSVHGLGSEDTELLDRCCSAARTVCETLLASGVEAQLYTNAGLVGYPGAPLRHVSAAQNRVEDLLDVLARVSVPPCSSPERLAAEALDVQTETAAWVLITPHADADADAALQMLNARSAMGALLLAADRLEED